MAPVTIFRCGSPISQIIDHYTPALEVLRLCRFPKVHSRTRYFKALVFIENPLNVLDTSHVHNPEAERMAPLIPQNSQKFLVCPSESSLLDDGERTLRRADLNRCLSQKALLQDYHDA